MSEDWTRWLTEEERGVVELWQQGTGQGTDDILLLARSLAASRALVAAKDEALEEIQSRLACTIPFQPDLLLEESAILTAAALALKEEEMLDDAG